MVIVMGICPRFGFLVDGDEPYFPEFCYDGTDNVNSVHDSDMFKVNGFGHDKMNVEDALDELGYDFDDLKLGFVDEDELEEILEDM